MAGELAKGAAVVRAEEAKGQGRPVAAATVATAAAGADLGGLVVGAPQAEARRVHREVLQRRRGNRSRARGWGMYRVCRYA